MAFEKFLEDIRSTDSSELTLDNIGVWPGPFKFLALLILVILVLVAFYYGIIADKHALLETKATEELSLKKSYKKKAFDTVNIQALRDQMVELKQSFSALLDQLPKDREVPGLLEDIDDIGRGSSVTIKDMVLLPERDAEYFVELPIRISAQGGYHDFGAFVSGIAALPRIVTLHDFVLKKSGDGSLLALDVQAKTYRYKPQGEE